MADTPNMLVVGVSVAIARGLAIARQFVLWAFADEPAQRELPKRSEPRRLSIAEQWTYLSDIVMGAASRAEEATRCHASATQQLDLAQYALTSLVDELSAVMDMGGRRRRATVHTLGVTPSPSLMPIGAAIAA
ncbi:hypothetical protein [Hyphomicrobium sp.]|jgi:hypothetical protein|uniref:hypothetical protein n=1 Tax=Hyphomicrobium sp. TaxID=82 RepID=UPI003562A80E